MTTTRQRATARLAARFGKLSRLAVLSSTATVAVVAIGVTGAASPDAVEDQTTQLGSGLGAATASNDLAHFAETREQRVSRTAPRVALQPKPTDHKFATAPLNIWTAPREEGKRLGLIKERAKVAVTGQTVGRWAEVLVPDGKRQVARWVNADFLANKKPQPEPKPAETTSTAPTSSSSAPAPAPGPSVGGACTNGTSVSGTPSVIEIHQAVCANWPSITSYGTYRAGDSGDHGSGRAIDIMISGATGWEIAEFVRANAGQFGVSYIIYSQKIWSVDRSGEGWRYMSSRGSATADHYDHVHVSVY
jgi:hypothetical protein